MAGSIKWFLYETDTGNEFAMLQDEDMGNMVGNTDIANAEGVGTYYGYPSNLEPRYAYYRSLDGRRTKKVVVGNKDTTTDTLPAEFIIGANNGEAEQGDGSANANKLILISLIAERYRPVISYDTGLNDGTPE